MDMTNDIAPSSGESGFGLVEALVATMITAIGVLSVAILMMVGARLQQNSRNGSNSWALVTAEIERIRTLAPTNPQRLDGGTLANSLDANHSAMRGTTMLRWVITNKPDACAPVGGVEGAPLECAKNISVVAITPNVQAIRAQVDSVLFR
jgi:Tfp pilus assembly protein PilV